MSGEQPEKSKTGLAGAVIVAAGSSQRMGGTDKIFALVEGKPLLARVVDVFQRCDAVDRLVIILSRESLEAGERLAGEHRWDKVKAICPGGRRRQDSVAAGLGRLEGCTWAIIHDAARPLVTEDLIHRGLVAARETGAAIAAVPVKDTIKLAGGDGLVRQTLPRQDLWAVQTPQVFRYELIMEAHRQVKIDVTDDAALVEQLGSQVKVYMGSYFNIKVTTAEDLVMVRALWQEMQG